MKKKIILLSVLLIVLLGIILVIDIPSSQDITLTNMGIIGREVNNYFIKNKKIPENLDFLSDSKFSEILNDGWNNPIQYKIDKNKKMITLKSLGADNTIGGDGKNLDIERDYILDLKNKS